MGDNTCGERITGLNAEGDNTIGDNTPELRITGPRTPGARTLGVNTPNAFFDQVRNSGGTSLLSPAQYYTVSHIVFATHSSVDKLQGKVYKEH